MKKKLFAALTIIFALITLAGVTFVIIVPIDQEIRGKYDDESFGNSFVAMVIITAITSFPAICAIECRSCWKSIKEKTRKVD